MLVAPFHVVAVLQLGDPFLPVRKERFSLNYVEDHRVYFQNMLTNGSGDDVIDCSAIPSSDASEPGCGTAASSAIAYAN